MVIQSAFRDDDGRGVKEVVKALVNVLSYEKSGSRTITPKENCPQP